MTKIGFDGYSLYEIEESWRDIELFYYVEPTSPHDYGPYVKFWIEPEREYIQKIRDTLKTAFGSRCEEKSHDLLIGGRLWLWIADTKKYIVIQLAPHQLRSLESVDFDLIRQIDASLRPLNLPLVPKPHRARAFFQGKVVE